MRLIEGVVLGPADSPAMGQRLRSKASHIRQSLTGEGISLYGAAGPGAEIKLNIRLKDVRIRVAANPLTLTTIHLPLGEHRC